MTYPLRPGTPRACPLCATPDQACTPSNPQHVIDVPDRSAKEPAVAELHVYEVPLPSGITTTMKLSAEDAKAQYGDQAKKVGDAKQGEPQPVSRPVHATNASDVTERPELPEDEAKPAEHLVTSPTKRAAQPQNKRR